MISYGGKRSEKSKQVMDAICSREWGLMLMDEVHVVPAKMFRRVVGNVKAHCRLGKAFKSRWYTFSFHSVSIYTLIFKSDYYNQD
jgi:hypothetical protein